MIQCTKCGSYNTKKKGIRREKQRCRCKDCLSNFTTPLEYKTVEPKTNKQAKILLFDVETSAILAYVFDIWQQNISISAIKQDWFILSWSAKWLYSNKIENAIVTPQEAVAADDSRIVLQMWKLLNEADIVLSYNGVNFDHKRLNTRFIKHSLPLPKPYRVIDLYQVAKNTFGFTSNKLDYLCKYLDLNLGKEKHSGISLWIDCMNGNEESLSSMETYNIMDTVILEDVYLALRPYIKNHPNINLYGELDDVRCPACGSTELVENGEYPITNQTVVMSYRCSECGALARGRTNLLNKSEKRNLLTG